MLSHTTFFLCTVATTALINSPNLLLRHWIPQLSRILNYWLYAAVLIVGLHSLHVQGASRSTRPIMSAFTRGDLRVEYKRHYARICVDSFAQFGMRRPTTAYGVGRVYINPALGKQIYLENKNHNVLPPCVRFYFLDVMMHSKFNSILLEKTSKCRNGRPCTNR